MQFHSFRQRAKISTGRMSFCIGASRPLAIIMRRSLELPRPSAGLSLKKADRGECWLVGSPWKQGFPSFLVPHTIVAIWMEQDMKLVVLGDIGVGKTSLIRR